MKPARRLAVSLMLCCSTAAYANGQAPSGPALPLPPEPFRGSIGATYKDSTPHIPAAPRAAPDAPNIVVILTDDVGFGAASTFGGPIPTPNLDRLAARGLVYNRFHTTAMCSPTRAALLTGRNHHAVANGIVANLSTGFPGYTNILPKSAATIAEILRQGGYNTAMFGKHHNAPEAHVSPAGPFDLWPTGLGFEHFFGFMAAETNQFTPALYRGTQKTATIEDGVLDKALADEAIGWIRSQKAAASDKPFFVYFATGSAHAPLQAPADWIARFRGKFDRGWDVVRSETIERQIKTGLVPAGTIATPRPEGIAAWASLTADQKMVTARMMEVYAAMLSYQDDQFGRLLAELERMNEADNTLVLFISGDNGSAAEGGPLGSLNPMARFANGMRESEADMLKALDAMGGPDSVGNYADGWAWATSAPFPMVKQYASHLGGVRNGLVLSWPARIRHAGVRSTFAHITDVYPTILEAAGMLAPRSVNGVEQQPVDGSSLVSSFAAGAKEPARTQYFEMMGNRAIYSDGWWAGTTPASTPWSRAGSPPGDPAGYAWELYDLRTDFAQARNLADQQPGKLEEMKALFDAEARRNNVYPLDNRLDLNRFAAAASFHRPRDRYTYWAAGISVPEVSAARLLNRRFTITSDVEVANGASGAILALGSKFGGWSFRLDNGRPTAVMAAGQTEGDRFAVSAAEPLVGGRHQLAFEFTPDGGVNSGGEMRVTIGGREIGRGRITRTISKLPELTDTLDIGFDADTPVLPEYGADPFEGVIHRVDVETASPTPRLRPS